jgi:phosphatidylglycerol:prolipoprotein diacylglycerol transferase
LFLKTHPITKELGLSIDQVNDLVFLYGLIFGAMIGGRIGYMFFYGTDQLLNDPLSLFYIWQGGLSFHGGLAGVIVSTIVFTKRFHIDFFRLTDGITLAMPIGLGLVRIGNFLNGELYGRATSGEWGFIFPTDPFGLPRHPSQLYESFFEGIVLFVVLAIINAKTSKRGIVSASFLILYGSTRFFIEFFRQPDAHIGFVALEWLSMGQLLCLPMIFAGFVLLTYFLRKA